MPLLLAGLVGCTGSIGLGLDDADGTGQTGRPGQPNRPGQSGQPIEPGPPGSPDAECVPQPGRPDYRLSAHTRFQVRTIIGQVFGAAVLEDAQVGAMIANLPLDLRAKHFDTETRVMSMQYVDAYTGLVRRLAGLAAAQPGLRRAVEAFVGVDCGGTLELDSACGQDLGRALMGALARGPVSEQTAGELFERYGTHKRSYQSQKAYAAFLASVLLDARSVLRFDTRQVEGGAEGERADAAALGARLAMTLTSGLPDTELRARIADGSITDPQVLDAQARRLLRTPAGGATLRHFAQQWLNVAALKAPPARQDFVGSADDSQRVADAAGFEIGRLFEHAVTSGATLRDFYTTDQVVPAHAWLGQLYEQRSGEAQVLSASMPERRGLLTRAAFHLHGAYADWLPLAHRGYGVRVTMLCGVVPPIPENVVFALPPEAPEVLSSSDYFKILTERDSCLGCHRAINASGYALSGYDVRGARITRESVPNRVTGERVEVEVDERAVFEIDGVEREIRGATELSQAIGESIEGTVCFAQRFAQYTVGAQVPRPCSGALPREGSLEDLLLAYVQGEAFALQ